MKANELRIGNWVKGITGNPIKLTGADIFVLEQGDDNGLCEPIPLTPEVLEKCGFEKSLGVYVINKACIFGSLSKINIYIEDYDADYEFTCPEHLHQLQNLYFALTGEELQYKP